MQGEGVQGVCRARVCRRLLLSWCAWLRYRHPHAFSTATGILYQNHYEVLGLKRNCTTTELKQQFIRLSKEFHPDTNRESAECHKRFVAINEAYSVLSKPRLRRAYDSQLWQGKPAMHTYGDIRTNAPHGRVVFHDDSLWEHRDKKEFHRNKDRPYYGVKGVKRLPNSVIAAGAVVFMVVGAMFHFFLAKTSSDYTVKHLNLRDQQASQYHMEVRERARANGNEMQIALLRQYSEESSQRK